MPEILHPYSISDLPQTSGKLSSPLSVSFGTSSSKVYFGISHSSLTAYSLKTTARTLWAHPISPVTQISSLIAGKKDNTLYFSTVNPKGKASLYQAIPKTDIQGESEERVLLSKCNYISGIYTSKQKEDILYIVFQSGEVKAFSINAEGLEMGDEKTKDTITEIWSIPAIDNGHKCLISRFIKSPSSDLPEDGLIVTVTAFPESPKFFDVRVVSLDTSEGRVLSSKTVSIEKEEVSVYLADKHDIFTNKKKLLFSYLPN